MVTDPSSISEFERGLDRAKYVQYLSPLGAFAAGTYAISTGTLAGLAGGVGLYCYGMVWVFANASGAVVIFFRNLAELKAIRSGTAPPRGPAQSPPKPPAS